MANERIGFIGFGEAAFHMAKGFGTQGVKELKAFDVLLAAENERRLFLDQRLKETGVG